MTKATNDNNLMPREKAMAHGIKSLSDRELMAILFGTGVQGKDVFALCDEILAANEGHLSKVAKMDWLELTQAFKGIGPAKALTLLAALELGVRASADAMTVRNEVMNSSEKVYEYMRASFYNLDHEQFWVMLLNNSNRVIKKICISQGGFNSTVVDIRIIFREAILAKTSAMILLHNHPSGRLEPSSQDIDLTRKVKEGAQIFSIRVLDHLVVNDTNYYSFNDHGIMP